MGFIFTSYSHSPWWSLWMLCPYTPPSPLRTISFGAILPTALITAVPIVRITQGSASSNHGLLRIRPSIG
jgi:hypothetical protein